MSCWTKEQLEEMLEDVVNELDLSEIAIEKHGPLATPPAELVRLVLQEKDNLIHRLKKMCCTCVTNQSGLVISKCLNH